MTAMRELNFTAVLHLNVFEAHQLLLEQVHHPDSLVESHHHMEARRVERHAIRLLFKQLVNLKVESILGCV